MRTFGLHMINKRNKKKKWHSKINQGQNGKRINEKKNRKKLEFGSKLG